LKRRGLLLDRDGVINIERDYVGTREQFEFMPGLFPFLNAAQDKGFRLAILTNQSGVARGLYTAEDHEKLTAWMLKELAGQGIAIDLVLACFEYEGGSVAQYKRESFWRKPNAGMVLEAVQRLNLDIARTAFIGDHPRDMQAGLAAGIGQCLYLSADGKDMPAGAKLVRGYAEALTNLSG